MPDITLLGNQHTKYDFDYKPEVLETFDNKHPDRDVSDIKQFIQMIVAKIKIKMVVADAETIKKG